MPLGRIYIVVGTASRQNLANLIQFVLVMAKKNARQIVVLKNPETGSLYYTRKSAHNTPDKLEMKKYDPKTRKVATFVESKVKLGG